MKTILCGTDRPNSNSLRTCKWLQKEYQSLGEEFQILELSDVPMNEVFAQGYSLKEGKHLKFVDQINQSEALVVVIPEYNGSYPGALKLFIDHWSYPQSFEFRPVAFIGIGGRFGGLRPVEHLQQVFGYRNSFIYPERVFISNVWALLTEDGDFSDEEVVKLLKSQCSGFLKFVKGLKSQELDALSR